jgi:hypothetical protein
MTSEELRYLIPGYVSGQLTSAEQALFEEQLRKSAELRAEVEELRSLWQGLELLPEEQPSAAMRARFYGKLNDLKSGRSRPLAGGFAWWKPGLPGLVRQLTLVLALFCLGIYVGRVSLSGRATQTEAAQLQNQVQSLRQTVALSLLDRQSATSRLEGISWGTQVARPDRDLLSALVSALDHDPNTNVRLASLDALEKFSADPTIRKALVNSISHQDSPLVQIALIDALVNVRDNSAAGEFRKLARDGAANAAVRQRAEWGLQKLTL